MLTSFESSLEFLSSRWAPSLTPVEKRKDYQALWKCGNAPHEIGFKIIPKAMIYTVIIWLLRAWYEGQQKMSDQKYISF